LLTAHVESDKREEAIFEIVGQLNRGAPLITSQDEREQLADLNLIAGKRAKAAAAHASALNYLITGVALVPKDGWERRHDLIFELELHRAECEFLTGEMASAEEHLRMLSSRAADAVQRAAVACLMADVYWALQRPDRGLADCLECLRDAGLDLPIHPTEAQAQTAYDKLCSKLDGVGIDELVERPLMTDPTSRAILDVLAKVLPSALVVDKNLVSLIVCSAVDISLERGHCDSSCFAYEYLGFIAGWNFGDFEAGFRFGQLGHELVERRGLRKFEGFVGLILSSCVMPWARHIATCRELVRTTFDVANRSGDRHSAVASRNEIVSNLLFAGDPLVEAEKEAEVSLEFCQRAAFSDYIDRANIQLAFIRNLRGLTRQFGSLDDERFDELRMRDHFATQPHLLACEYWYWVRRLQARFLAGDYAAALDASIRGQGLRSESPGALELVEYELYSAITHATVFDSVSPDERRRHLDAVAAHLRQLEVWARHCPENFENRAALVAAEIARMERRDPDAMRLYELAIRSARENGFVHNEALALELAARFYLDRKLDRIARAYMRDARSCYLQWGADGKVRQLDELHPYLREEDQHPEPTRTRETPIEQLDLAAVLKVLQAVSGETDLGRLIATIMRLGIEHAGAERGLLILPRDGGYRVEAEAGIGSDAVTVTLGESSITAETLPQSAFHFVLRTRETVLLHDASAENTDDPYIRQRRSRSVLCMPLLKQTRMVGVLYLENSLTSSAFTPTRMALLKLLASEGAISIENARLYRDLAERESRIRRLVDANIIGIFFWELEGRILEANDAFLTMVGYQREDLIEGRLNWTDLTPPEWRDRDERRWMPELKQSGTLQPFEKEYFRKDGSRVPVLIGLATFEETGHQGVAYVLDLTERKRAQDALNRAGAELAHVSRVTALSALTASIAHEVNQPLSGIITNASTCLRMLDTTPPDIDGARVTARRTIRDGNRASDVVTRLRALFSKRDFTLDSLDLNEAAREVIALSSNELQRHRIILQSEFADDLPLVTGDRIQLQQVIINLLRNAADAMADVQDRSRQLLIKTEREEHGDKVRLTVRDAGVGLSAQSLDSLFAAFHTTKSGGMGIGLFVSRSIIERHHGRLWAEPNHEAPGATFSFSLPCGAEPGRDTVSASSAS
jgi:PAS domain S-box-containing protein